MEYQEYKHYSRLSIYRKGLLVLSAVFVFCNYYYLYFVGFDQGRISGGGYFSIIKVVGLAFFVLAFFEIKLNLKFYGGELLLLLFFVLSGAIFLLKKTEIEVGSNLYFNFLICMLPFFVFPLKRNVRCLLFFLEVCLWLLFAQVLIDSALKNSGISLWENRAFVGGLGNPSSFGIFCNVVLSYVLFLRERKASSLFFVILLVYSILNTKSMFSLFGMAWVLFYYSWSKSKLGAALLMIFASVGLYFLADNFFSGHLEYKLHSLYRVIFESDSSGSQSVLLRVEIHKLFFDKFLSSPIFVTLFGYDDYYYYNVDSQFLSFFGSFGIFVSALFFLTVFSFLIVMRRPQSGLDMFFWVSLSLFFVMFFSNRILDYYPIPVLFFLLLFGSKRLTARELR